ncbi:hypothetical protein U3516DRAFT_782116 [Neocallimastix sp. 'constans']
MMNNNNEDFKVKYYDLYRVVNYIKEITKMIELENKNKNKVDNFELSNYWVYSEKNEELQKLLKNILFFSGYLTIVDKEEYKENFKNMDDKMIKFTSNEPKLIEMDSNEIQSNKNNLLKKIKIIQGNQRNQRKQRNRQNQQNRRKVQLLEHFYQLFLMQLFFNLNVKDLVAEQESGYN